MDKEKFLHSGLLEQYVLGLTTPEENQEVERYAEAFPEIQSEIDGMRRALEEYASQYTVPPPSHVKEKILRETEDEGSDVGERMADAGVVPVDGTWRSVNWAVMFSLFAVLALGLTAYNFFQQKQRVEDRYESLSARFAAYQASCEEAREKNAEGARLYAFLTHPETRPVRLTGTQLAPESETMVYWNPGQQTAYFSSLRLPAPPPGKTYQLWADVEGEMINMGVVDVRDGALQAVTVIEQAESLNLTLEPEGGSDHPTVELLMLNGKV